jgi:hypothetical protein
MQVIRLRSPRRPSLSDDKSLGRGCLSSLKAAAPSGSWFPSSKGAGWLVRMRPVEEVCIAEPVAKAGSFDCALFSSLKAAAPSVSAWGGWIWLRWIKYEGHLSGWPSCGENQVGGFAAERGCFPILNTKARLEWGTRPRGSAKGWGAGAWLGQRTRRATRTPRE